MNDPNETKVLGYNSHPEQELNIVIHNQYQNQETPKHLFGNESYITMGQGFDMYDILFYFGIFTSKSEARKNWTRTGKDIPPGYNEFKGLGKKKKNLYIWNPIRGDE